MALSVPEVQGVPKVPEVPKVRRFQRFEGSRGSGTEDAAQSHVPGVKRYEDLIAWQLAYELQRAVFALTATGAASTDFKFRDQIRDSSSSATRNIAEAFGRWAPAEFARFLRIARGSLNETHNSVRDGRDRGYFTAEDAHRMQLVAGRAAKAITRLIRYLESCAGQKRRGSQPPPRTPGTSGTPGTRR